VNCADYFLQSLIERTSFGTMSPPICGQMAQVASTVGLGLGLHIGREIVERHGGAVGVRSAEGQGSTFWFTLPIERTGELR
jgi:K+-sensing histidine kinase KdpD